MSKLTESQLKSLGLAPSKFELAITKYVPTQGALTLFQVALFILAAYSIVNCPFGSIYSVLAMCVSVFSFVATCLLIVDYKGASSVDSILKGHLITTLCIIIGYLA